VKMSVISPQVRVGRNHHDNARYRVVVHVATGALSAYIEFKDPDGRLYWHRIKDEDASGIGRAVFAVLSNPEEKQS
jgi:hexokinase